jgi:hypothetical protein
MNVTEERYENHMRVAACWLIGLPKAIAASPICSRSDARTKMSSYPHFTLTTIFVMYRNQTNINWRERKMPVNTRAECPPYVELTSPGGIPEGAAIE